ncbi:MAG: hypothetical protein MJ186_02515 [Clostridia bacterium]|nr:hypothetical protein [Clostridia bacterium]
MKSRKIITFVLAAILVLSLVPAQIFAAGAVKVSVNSNISVAQGDSAYVNVSVQADEEINYKITLTSSNKDITIASPTSGILSGNQDHVFSFTTAKRMTPGYHTMELKIVDANDANTVYAQREVSVDVAENRDGFSTLEIPAVDVSYIIKGSDKLIGGQKTYVSFSIYNRSNVDIRNARITLKTPQGITIADGSLTRNLGLFTKGKTSTVEYPILVDSEVKTGSYEFVITVSGTKYETEYLVVPTGPDTGKVESHTKPVALDNCAETIYIPVSGKGSAAGDEANPILMVSGFSTDKEVKAGDEFALSFNVKNTSSKNLRNIKLVVNGASGAVIPTGSSSLFIQNIASGQTAAQTINMKALKGAKSDTPEIHIAMSYEDENGNKFDNTDSITLSMKEGTADGSVVNPILMVSGCTFGGSAVTAGNDFPLTITLTNTSGKTLRNIKMTVADASGYIIPSNGASSVFIANIPAGTSASKTIQMNCAKACDKSTCQLTVSTSYEDLNSGTYTATDNVTIPVIQDNRFVVDDILDPGWLYEGEAAYVTVNYYNMGSTSLSNLRIAVSGVNVDGNASTYVGNISAGRSDYYNFSFYPEAAGPCTGLVTFTFEDAVGQEVVVEKDFTFNINEAMQWDDPIIDPIPEQQPGLPLWGKGLIALAVLAAGVFGFKAVKKSKKAKAEALELDD